MEKLANITVGLVVLSLVFLVIERCFAANKQQKIFRTGYRLDLIYWFFTPLVTKSITLISVSIALILIYDVAPKDLKSFVWNRETWITSLPSAVQIFLLLLITDFIGYWMHRSFHGKKLWKIHAIHHCSEELDWLSSGRLHPLNDTIARLVQFVILLAIGFTPKMVAIYAPFLVFFALLLHANVTWGYGWFGNIIASPRFHRWHHTSQQEGLNKNFAGMFPLIDRIFGTYYMPKNRMPEKFGIYGEKIPDNFWGQMAYPFKKMR